MSDLSFRRGEILTADKLNLLVQSVARGAPSAAVGNGKVLPSQPHQVRQREFSSYVPVRRPIYIDQTSPHWPLANGEPGWYWRESADSALTLLPDGLSEGGAVYLKTNLDPVGTIESQTLQYEPPENEEWNPFENKKGVISEKLGIVAADPYKSGTKATTLQFFEAPASPVIPRLLASPLIELARDCCWVPSFMPPATYLERASLLGGRAGNTQFLNTIHSDGGLIFKGIRSCCHCFESVGVQLIPRLAILPAPSTELPTSPPPVGSQLRPGRWHEMAAVNIAGQRLALNMAWVNPWMAYINLSVDGDLEPLHQTWKKEWGMPGIAASPPMPFRVDSWSWRVVSRTSPTKLMVKPEWFPAGCAWIIQEEKILQATGDYTHCVDENGNILTQPVIFQAYIRQQLAPTTGGPCIWYDQCWTNLYDVSGGYDEAPGSYVRPMLD